jgi:A/G-specific adenine glycosylase
MLQQTQVKTVVAYWERWMRALPDIRAVAQARPQALHKLWEGLGYYTRVRNLQKAARVIQAEYGGKFPREFNQVLALPGIGRYTAGAICSIAYDQPTPVLDGNVIRILSRLFGIEGDPKKTPANARLWTLARELAEDASHSGPAGSCSCLSQALMELGATVCTPRQPACGVCPAAGLCAARRQGRQETLPQAASRARVTPRRFVAFIARSRGKLLVRQRPAGVVNGHLWEFPNAEIAAGHEWPERSARELFGVEPARLEPLCVVRHSITRYRITLEAFLIEGLTPPAGGRWLTPGQLSRLPFASAHGKILRALDERELRKGKTRPHPPRPNAH